MSNIFDITSQVQERRNAEQRLVREKELEKAERAKEKELEHIERQKEKQSDRWFQVFLLITGAAIGALCTELADYFFK